MGPLLAAAWTALRKRSSASGRASISSIDSFDLTGSAPCLAFLSRGWGMSDTPEETGIPMLGITSDPLPMPPEMFTVLGEIVILWSRIETSIDTDLGTMKQWPVVKQMVPNRLRAFSKKLEFWRRAVRTLYPKVAVYQAHAAEFERVASMIAPLRNHL